MTRVLHVKGRELEELSEQGTYEFLDGDVYVIDNGNDIYIWRGKDCGVDEQTVGAWVSNQLDNEERGGEPTVHSLLQGEETEDFKNLLNFEVKDGDTAGFLQHVELDTVEYKLFRVYIDKDTESIDEAKVKEVKLSPKSLNHDDVFVLDGNESVYMYVGKDAQREERFEGQKIMQKIDAERNYLPLTYTIYEGEGGKSERDFYDLLKRAGKEGSAISVEDQRELDYSKDTGKTAEVARKEKEKKGFLAKLFGIFR